MGTLRRLQREAFQQLLTLTKRLETLEGAREATLSVDPPFLPLLEFRRRNPAASRTTPCKAEGEIVMLTQATPAHV